jgi:predicted DNA-binding transcriptional regulator YafY
VAFDYRGLGRRVHPYALLLRAGSWYVIGEDPDKQAVRTFRVDRMSSIAVLEPAGAFERPAGFDPRQEFPLDPKEIGGDETAVVRIDSPGGPTEVRVPCANIEAFRAWLFDLDDHAEVLHPDHVRAAVVDWLTSMVAG